MLKIKNSKANADAWRESGRHKAEENMFFVFINCLKIINWEALLYKCCCCYCLPCSCCPLLLLAILSPCPCPPHPWANGVVAEEGEEDGEERPEGMRPRRVSQLSNPNKAKPLPPYSSFFIFSHTNRYVCCCVRVCLWMCACAQLPGTLLIVSFSLSRFSHFSFAFTGFFYYKIIRGDVCL